MDNSNYILDGFAFATEEEYNAALEEKRKIEILRGGLRMTDAKKAREVYDRCKASQTFQTQLGKAFMAELMEIILDAPEDALTSQPKANMDNMIQCPACGRWMAKTANSCVNCGGANPIMVEARQEAVRAELVELRKKADAISWTRFSIFSVIGVVVMALSIGFIIMKMPIICIALVNVGLAIFIPNEITCRRLRNRKARYLMRARELEKQLQEETLRISKD